MRKRRYAEAQRAAQTAGLRVLSIGGGVFLRSRFGTQPIDVAYDLLRK